MTEKLCSLLLVFCLLTLLPGACSAKEYQTTEAELTRLEQIFDQLENNNKQLLADLKKSKTDLATARQKLEEYQQDLKTLQNQLQALKTESAQARIELETAQKLLEKVNQSFLEYEQEVKSEIKALKWQRGVLVLAVGILAFR